MAKKRKTDLDPYIGKATGSHIIDIVRPEITTDDPAGSSFQMRVDDFLKGNAFRPVLGCLVYQMAANPSKTQIEVNDRVIYFDTTNNAVILGIALDTITSIPADLEDESKFQKLVGLGEQNIYKFKGGFSNSARNQLVVPENEYWLIYNTSSDLLEIGKNDPAGGTNGIWDSVGDGLQAGANYLPDGLILDQALMNHFYMIKAEESPFNEPYVEIAGGGQPDGVILRLRPSRADLISITTAEIHAGATSQLITKGYLEEYYSGLANNDVLTSVEVDDGFNILASHFTSGRTMLWYNDANDIEINLPDVAALGEKIIIWSFGIGSINVRLGDGVSGTHAKTVDNSNPFTYVKTPVGYQPVGNFEEYVPTPSDFYSPANAASVINEQDSTAGTSSAVGSPSWSSVASDVADVGDYMLRMTASAANDEGLIQITGLTPNQEYLISVRGRENAANWQMLTRDYNGWLAQSYINDFDSVMELKSMVATPTSSTASLSLKVTSAGTSGDTFDIGTIEITEN